MESISRKPKNSADGCATSIDEFGKSVKQANTEVDDLNQMQEKPGKYLPGLVKKLPVRL